MKSAVDHTIDNQEGKEIEERALFFVGQVCFCPCQSLSHLMFLRESFCLDHRYGVCLRYIGGRSHDHATFVAATAALKVIMPREEMGQNFSSSVFFPSNRGAFLSRLQFPVLSDPKTNPKTKKGALTFQITLFRRKKKEEEGPSGKSDNRACPFAVRSFFHSFLPPAKRGPFPSSPSPPVYISF